MKFIVNDCILKMNFSENMILAKTKSLFFFSAKCIAVYFIIAGCFALVTLTSFNVSRGNFQNNTVIIKSIDPLIKITPDFSPNSNETNKYDVARNEDVHVQLVVWNKLPVINFSITYNNSSATRIPLVSTQRVGDVSINQPAGTALSEKVISINNIFPDPLLDVSKSVSLD